MNWLILALIALISGLFAQLLLKYLLINNIKNLDILLLIGLICGICSLFYYIFKIIYKKKFDKKLININYIICIFLITIALTCCAFSLTKAIEISPNPGYPVGVSSTGFIFLSIACYFIFGSELNYITFIGLLFILLGISIIVKYC